MIACTAAAGLLVLSGCQSGDGDADGEATQRPPGTAAQSEVPAAAAGELAGYARDVNGNPVAGARIGQAGAEASVQTDARGRYRLRVPGGDVTLVAEHEGFVPQQVSLAERPPGGRLDFSLAATEPGAATPDSAHRLHFWTGCGAVAELSQAELDRWIELGVDGFVCSMGRLASTGGQHAFDADPAADLSDDSYSLQRALESSAAVRMARAGRLTLYLGFYASNAYNRRTPFEEWFDDEAWAGELLPALGELAGVARSLGFAGVAIDQELYPAPEDTEATWVWDYPGNERSEEEVRAQAAERGRQLMETLLEAFPGIELVGYDTDLPEAWAARVQEVANGRENAYESDVKIDFWDGLSSVPGYSAIRWLDATFYKASHAKGDWDTALRYNANRIYSLLSRRFSNWSYASSRLHVSPFSWIDSGRTEFTAARPPEYVAEQLDAFSRWGMGGMIANYDYGQFGDFDYDPYRDALVEASTPARVEHEPPRLVVGTPSVDGGLRLAGTAGSSLAIRSVRWYDEEGRFGTAQLESDGTSVEWRLAGARAPAGKTRLTIVAEDTKGLATARSLTFAP